MTRTGEIWMTLDTVNHKKVERLYYREEQLALQRRCSKKSVAVPRVALP